MKKFIVSSLISFLLVFVCIIGVSYNFYKHILYGYIDKRIENTVYVNNLSTSDAISSQIDYNIMALNAFYNTYHDRTLKDLNKNINDVELINCENIIFGEIKNSNLILETSTHKIKGGFSLSNFTYEKFSVIDLTDAFTDCDLGKCAIFFFNDNRVAIVRADEFLMPIFSMRREYEPDAFLINKNGYIYFQNGKETGDYFYDDYLSSVSTNSDKEKLIDMIINGSEGVDNSYYVRGQRCYLTYNKIVINEQSEYFYLISVFYKEKLVGFEKSLIIPLVLLLTILSLILVVGLAVLFGICFKKNEDIQSSRLSLYYSKPYIFRVNKKGRIIYRNSAFKKLNIDWDSHKNITDFDCYSDGNILEDIKKNNHFMIRLVDLSGKNIVINLVSLKIGFNNYIIGDDVTKQYEEMNYAVKKISYDEVTHLPTKEVLLKDLEKHLEKVKTSLKNGIKIESSLVVFCIDSLERYARIFGNKMINKLVLNFVKLVSELLKEDMILYRLSKDKFAVLFKNLETYNDVISWLNNLKNTLKKPIEIDANDLIIRCHSGIFNIEMEKYDGLDNNSICEYAEIAFEKAKGLNVSDYIIYDISLGKLIKKEQLMEEDLRKAIKKGELIVYIQPQCDASNRKIIGFEALVRWNNPKYINDSPQHFIELAEKNNMIIPIGKIIIRQALQIAKKLEGQGITISINVSPAQLIQDGFVTQMIGMTEEEKVNPNMIALEITETFLVQNIKLMAEKMKVLKKHGFIIHLDDFGTGYSSMLYLKDLPIDAIKIDKEFIKYINTDKSSRIIVSKIISLAISLDMKIIAEGVEDEKQYQFLKKNGCEVIQGFLISKAVPYEEALELIEKYNYKK